MAFIYKIHRITLSIGKYHVSSKDVFGLWLAFYTRFKLERNDHEALDLSYGECQISRKFVWRHAGDVYPIPVTLLSKCLFSFNFSDHAMRLNLRSANFAFMAKMISIRRIIILPANQYPCCFEGWRKTWFGWEHQGTGRWLLKDKALEDMPG